MTSEEAIQEAIDALKYTNYGYPESAKARARGADSWVRVAEFLRESENRG